MTNKNGSRPGSDEAAHRSNSTSTAQSKAAGKPLSIAVAVRFVTPGVNDIVIVASCPLCGWPHRHTARTLGTDLIRRPPCRPWKRYAVRIIQVVPVTAPEELGGAA